jgi:Tol biopolymer transport system component
LDIAARFPAISPDGSWLAYSHAEHGAWQLEVMKRATRERRRLTREECNSLTPAWTPDGAKIVYASDCGRGLGATALCEMAFVP